MSRQVGSGWPRIVRPRPQHGVQARSRPFLADGDIPEQRRHLALLVDRGPPVVLRVAAGPATVAWENAPTADTREGPGDWTRANPVSAATASSPGSRTTR
ncbi:hypothetical protein ABZ137_13145 [Streptomyces bobili]|uniref:hypothetical protein n=1 Tax=Streptomyces bobili TaxID=67280 RepID=UPI0033B5A53A